MDLGRVQKDARNHDDVALVIADEVARQERFRLNVREYQTLGTWGWKAETLDRIGHNPLRAVEGVAVAAGR